MNLLKEFIKRIYNRTLFSKVSLKEYLKNTLKNILNVFFLKNMSSIF